MSNPADLNVVTQPDTDKNYFNFKATNLKVNKTYAIKFQWAYSDGQLSDWSPGYFITTSNETAPAVPTDATVPSTGTGSIPVTLTTFPTNAKRVDVIITGGVFGTSKVAYSFTTAGTTTIAAPAGTYQVQLRAISPTGVTSTVGTTFSVVISDAGEVIQSPTNPNGFSSKRILAGIEVSWAGTYATGTFTGFEAINIYAGSSATATNGTYEQVGVLTGNNVKNTIVVPLGTYVVYGQAVYIHAAAVNKNGSVGTIQANVTNQTLGPGKATDADINDGAVVISKLASDVLTVGNLKAGDINATSFIRAGTAGSARVEISSSTVGSVLPGLTVYASDGTTQLLRAPLTGGLTINGSGTFSGNISAATGQFDGDLGASGGNFTVRSGTVTALAGNIGGWVINENAFKSTAVAFPTIELDPGYLGSGPKFEIRQSAHPTSESGIKVIKIDPTSGIRAGTTSNFKFTVDMDGIMSATDAIISGTVRSSNIFGSTIATAESSTARRAILNPSTHALSFFATGGVGQAHISPFDDANNPGFIISAGSSPLSTIGSSSDPAMLMYKNSSSGNYITILPGSSQGTTGVGIFMSTGISPYLSGGTFVSTSGAGFGRLRNISTVTTTNWGSSGSGYENSGEEGEVLLVYAP